MKQKDNEYIFSKLEIATFLKDFKDIFYLANIYPNEKLLDIYKTYMHNNNSLYRANGQYYGAMIKISTFIIFARYMAIYEEEYGDFILPEDLDGIEFDRNIFVNPSDYDSFANNKLLIFKYIRNAISHNNHEDKELYVLKRVNNQIYLEIDLKNTKPIPFHVQINLIDFIKIASKLNIANKYDLYKDDLGFNKFSRIILQKTIKKEKIERLKNIPEGTTTQQVLNNILNPGDYREVTYQALHFQRKAIEDRFFHLKQYADVSNAEILDACFTYVMPMPFLKMGVLHGLVKIAAVFSNHRASFNMLDKQLLDLKDFGLLSRDVDLLNCTLRMVYYAYVFNTLTTDDTLEYKGTTYQTSQIRNPLTHCRFGMGPMKDRKGRQILCFNLYDWANGEDKRLQSFEPKLTFEALELERFADTYYNKALAQNTEHFMDLPITLLFNNTNEDKLAGIGYAKDETYYIYGLKNDSAVKDITTKWGIFKCGLQKQELVVDEQEVEMFFKELSNLPKEDKDKYRDILKILRPQYYKYIQYRNKQISLQQLEDLSEYNLGDITKVLV